MTCGIYMIQNKVNGKIYIGQAVDIERRWGHHKWELRSNHHKNYHLQRAWNKYEEDNFEFTIICECDESQLNTMEIDYIAKLKTYDPDYGYNKTYGGEGGRPTEETREKMREAQKGENHPMYGKHHTEESRNKISEAVKGENNPFYGKHHKEESKQKISDANKGKYVGKNNPFYGQHHSEETRKKISELRKGETRSEETKKKQSKAMKGDNNPMYGKHGSKNPNSIPVVQLTLDEELVSVYESSVEARRSGFNSCNIINCIRGGQKTHKGYKWMRLDDYKAMKKEGLEK